MKTIWKYQIGSISSIFMPKGAKFLSIQTQDKDICAWFEVDPENERETRVFNLIGTGFYFEGGNYLGTVQCGLYVFHLYEGAK